MIPPKYKQSYLGQPGNRRVVRGGAWHNNQNNARAVYPPIVPGIGQMHFPLPSPQARCQARNDQSLALRAWHYPPRYFL